MAMIPFALIPEYRKAQLMHLAICKFGTEVRPGVWELSLTDDDAHKLPPVYHCEIETGVQGQPLNLTLRVSATEPQATLEA